jgi:hypothetical protein
MQCAAFSGISLPLHSQDETTSKIRHNEKCKETNFTIEFFYIFDVCRSGANSPPKTVDRPMVKKGDAGDAAVASNDDRLAIHVTGRHGASMPTKKYATMLANAFADRKYTDKPMYITVTYSERDEEGETFATIYMDGGRYRTKEGYNVFTPE